MTVSTASSQAVAALPGGQALAQIAAELDGNSAAINTVASAWTTAADNAATYTSKITDAVQDVADDWQGSAADAFTGLMRSFAEASSIVQQPLLTAGQALTDVATVLQNSQQKVDGICQWVLGQASQIEDEMPAGTARNTALLELTGEGASQAQPYAEQAESSLKQASQTLSDAVAALGKKPFSSLPVPKSESFGAQATPADGTTTSGAGASGWTPDATPGSVSLSGSIGSSGTGSGGTGAPGGGTGASGAGLSGTGTSGVGLSGTGGSGGAGGSGGGEPGPTSPVSSGGGTPAAPAQVDEWIEEAFKVLEAHGVPASELNAQDVWIIIEHESSGNPDAVNNWDSNAAAGTPSEGLMQTIAPTFNAYALPGYNTNILDPVSNIIAGVRYAISRYGSLANVPGVVAVNSGQPYVGY